MGQQNSCAVYISSTILKVFHLTQDYVRTQVHFAHDLDFFSKTTRLMLKLEGSIRIYVKSQQKVPQLDLVTLGATSRISIHSITGIKLVRGLRRAYRLLLFCSPKLKRVRPSLKFTIGKENSRKTKIYSCNCNL